MKIKTFGNRSPLSGLKQLEAEFIKLGHEIVDSGGDVLFHGNGFFQDLLDYSKQYPKALKVGLLLDADITNANWPENQVKEELRQLDIKLTISKTAQDQIIKRTGEKCEIVYYPIKPVSNKKYPKTLDFMTVGRIYSSNKRFILIEPFLKTINYDKENLVVVGPECPPFGSYTNIVDNETLNEIYNYTRYLLFFSSTEGLGLSQFESIISGCLPLLCNDNLCVKEFGLEEFAANPNPLDLAKKLQQIESNKPYYLELAEELGERFSKQFSAESVAKNIIELIEEKL